MQQLMMVIHKYAINLIGVQHINLPEGFKILDIQQQPGSEHPNNLQMWVLHEHQAPCDQYVQITCQPTGDPFDHIPLNHIKTIQLGNFVWHFFEETLNHGN